MSDIINTTNTEGIFEGGEFVLTRIIGENGETEFMSGGYKVNSFFLQGGMSALTTLNTGTQDGIQDGKQDGKQDGGKVSSPFENLAVPAGLFYINQRVPKNEIDTDDHYYKKHEMISDDMIDKLFGLVEANKKQKRKTRKNIIKQDKRKTKRSK